MTPPPFDLLLIRHGQSEANAGITDDPDSGLTELGIEQASSVAERLIDFDLRGVTALTSPYRRTRQTAEIIAAKTGLVFSADQGIREWGVTAEVDGKVYRSEPLNDVVIRLTQFLANRRGERLLIVSHATPIALLAELAMGRPPTLVGDFWDGVENGCLREIRRS
jgi:broad specificity phosphatase PhoE